MVHWQSSLCSINPDSHIKAAISCTLTDLDGNKMDIAIKCTQTLQKERPPCRDFQAPTQTAEFQYLWTQSQTQPSRNWIFAQELPVSSCSTQHKKQPHLKLLRIFRKPVQDHGMTLKHHKLLWNIHASKVFTSICFSFVTIKSQPTIWPSYFSSFALLTSGKLRSVLLLYLISLKYRRRPLSCYLQLLTQASCMKNDGINIRLLAILQLS